MLLYIHRYQRAANRKTSFIQIFKATLSIIKKQQQAKSLRFLLKIFHIIDFLLTFNVPLELEVFFSYPQLPITSYEIIFFYDSTCAVSHKISPKGIKEI